MVWSPESRQDEAQIVVSRKGVVNRIEKDYNLQTIESQSTVLDRRFQKYKKNIWIRDVYEEREEKGEHHLLFKELRLHDAEYSFKCFRMTPAVFQEHLNGWGLIFKKTIRK